MSKQIMGKATGNMNMSPEELENDIKEAIREAMATKDPKAQALWKEISPDGKEPTVEEFLDFCVSKVKERSGAFEQGRKS